jgi:predicted phage terminase large subunit-like protein
MSPARFAELASGGSWVCKPHHRLMNERALAITAGEIDRHMMLQPPQTGKSQFWSMWFPAWYLGMYPDRRVILGSYNSEYASEWGMKVRDILEEHGHDFFRVQVRPDLRAKDNWGLIGPDGKVAAGGMRTMGMDSGITGKAADLFLIDDPVKGAEDALSPAIRQRVWDVYASCVDSRIQPDGAICLTMTPWHPDDLGGRLLMVESDRLKVLRLPALAEAPIDPEVRERRKGYDALVGAPDPMGRPPGRALWPERFDEAHYEHKRRLDPFWFDALYQCQPKPRDGGFFKLEWFAGKGQVYVPREARRVRAWDTASSYNKGDWTVGVLLAENNGLFYVEDVRRFRLGPDERDSMIRDVAASDERKFPGLVTIWIEQAFGGGGKTEGAGLVRKLAGFHVQLQTNETNKEARAQPFASQCQAGNVKYCWGEWNDDYLGELTSFPNGKHDDQVDATSLAFAKLALDPEPGGYASITQDEYELLEAGGHH